MLLFLALLVSCLAQAQDSAQVVLPENYLSKVEERVGALEEKLDRKSEQVLKRFQQQEERIHKKLSRIDSTRAAQYLTASKQQYQQLEQKLKNPSELSQYLPFLDTLNTSIKFLGEHQELLGKAKDAATKLRDAGDKVRELKEGLARAETIKQFLKERKQQLKEQLANLPFARDLKKLNKQAYYYSAQVQEYKAMFKDPKKIERKALELLSKTRPFQEFMRRNSELASLFRLPGSGNTDLGTVPAGLQTRTQVSSVVQTRLAAGGPAAVTQVRNNIQTAQAQLDKLKSKLEQYSQGTYGNTSSDIDLPDFKPNSQKTKSFFRRLEVGTNVQSQRARYFFPVTSDLGLSLGYKLNDKSTIGVGAAYKLGLGSGWQQIKLSHQGLGLRSYVDYKLKGTFYLSGGYEQNFYSEIHSIDQLREHSAWQVSGLLGLSKKYKVSKKLKGEMKLLWDFLSYRQVPQTQAVLFRVGYSLK